MDPFQESQRTLDLLRERIEDSPLSRREIAVRAGLSRGGLGRLLAGRSELHLWQLLDVLAVLGEDPATFLRKAFRPPRPRRTATGRDPHDLAVNDDVVRIYGLGIASIRELRRRLGRCEEALAELGERLQASARS